MAKVRQPTQRKLNYQTLAIGVNLTQAGYVSLPKDLSIVNRYGLASTTRQGVPLIYRVRATVWPSALDGSGYTTQYGSGGQNKEDTQTTVVFLGCQNNWVMLEAAKKWHRAREAFFRRAGVTKQQRGAYAHEIRYNFDGTGQTWLAPFDGDGAAFTGGTWDMSVLADSQDSSYQLALTGTGIDETAASAATYIVIGDSYLKSRMTVPVDSNLEASDVPAKYSHLNDLLVSGDDTRKDDTKTIAEGEQDNPPYDQLTGSETGHDITEPVELGRVVLTPRGGLDGTQYFLEDDNSTFEARAQTPVSFMEGSGPRSVVMDVPFGIFEIKGVHDNIGDTNAFDDALGVTVELLGIKEMTG